MLSENWKVAWCWNDVSGHKMVFNSRDVSALIMFINISVSCWVIWHCAICHPIVPLELPTLVLEAGPGGPHPWAHCSFSPVGSDQWGLCQETEWRQVNKIRVFIPLIPSSWENIG